MLIPNFLNDVLSNLTSFCRDLANFPVFSCLNVLTSLSPVGYMESGARPLGVAVEKDKGKKTTQAPHGKYDKDQMKYNFQGEPIN